MLYIGKPRIENRDSRAFAIVHVTDEVRKIEEDLWYSVDEEYGKYLVTEVADAFLHALMSIAVSLGEDITCEAPISEKLLLHTQYELIPMLTKIIPNGKHIKIIADCSTPVFHPTAVCCGSSMGVDSFSAIITHTSTEMHEEYRLTHLSISNTGHFGYDDLEGASKAFYENLEVLKGFADEVGLDLVGIDTNLSWFYRGFDLTLNQTCIERTLSAPLILQKLFKRYVYATSNPMTLCELNNTDSEDSQGLSVPLMSTENLDFIVATPMMTRVEKTALIAGYPLSYKYLDVCWYNIIKNMDSDLIFKFDKKMKNCGKCGKCLRTCLTLELLGKLDEYSDIFDIEEYRKHKNKYIIKVLAAKNECPRDIEGEIYDLLTEKRCSIPLHIRIAGWLVRNNVLDFVPHNLIRKLMAR